MSEDIAVSISHVSKDFKLPHEQKNSIKEHLINFKKQTYEKLHALDDIDVDIKKGEFFGIVGRNGSGKSTLLKIIGGIYQPTKGSLRINGTLTPFIELGIGFNPELTGRDNVFLNGAILGLTRKEIIEKYDEIVGFAELERFMDQKLKNYSSGMQVRLAFSIAIQAHNDILLIDEVLAVGDSNFQRKCYNIFHQIKESNKTVIFVTHDMGAVQQFCDRAMMIQDSKVLLIGKPRDVALRYEVANSGAAAAMEHNGQTEHQPGEEVELLKVHTRNKQQATSEFKRGEDIYVDIDFKIHQLDTPLQFNVFVVQPDGTYLAGLNTTTDLGEYKPTAGKHRLTCHLKADQLVKGEYYIGAAAYTHSEPARLINLLDRSFGDSVPLVTILEASPTQDGKFNLEGNWKEAKHES